MIKYLLYFLAAFSLVFIQVSFLDALPLFMNLNLILVILIFINIVFGFDTSFIFALLFGFFLNLYTFLPLGIFIIIFLAIIWLIDFLYKNIFINFSFFSNLILVAIGTIAYAILVLVTYFLAFLAGATGTYIIIDKIFWQNFFSQIILNLFFMVCLFYLAKLTIKRLNTVFLFKK